LRGNWRYCCSICAANIAEGFGRKSHREFSRFAYIAKGSEHEVLNGFIEAHQKGYITAAELDRGDHAARKALKVLNGLIHYLDSTPDW
jgi:four helix bundle protein